MTASVALELPEIEPIANTLFVRPAGQMRPDQNKSSESAFDLKKNVYLLKQFSEKAKLKDSNNKPTLNRSSTNNKN